MNKGDAGYAQDITRQPRERPGSELLSHTISYAERLARGTNWSPEPITRVFFIKDRFTPELAVPWPAIHGQAAAEVAVHNGPSLHTSAA